MLVNVNRKSFWSTDFDNRVSMAKKSMHVQVQEWTFEGSEVKVPHYIKVLVIQISVVSMYTIISNIKKKKKKNLVRWYVLYSKH